MFSPFLYVILCLLLCVTVLIPGPLRYLYLGHGKLLFSEIFFIKPLTPVSFTPTSFTNYRQLRDCLILDNRLCIDQVFSVMAACENHLGLEKHPGTKATSQVK